MKHYSKEELEQYRRQTMPLLARLACAAHLRDCSDCAHTLAELLDDDSLVSDIRDSLRRYAQASDTAIHPKHDEKNAPSL
ncbi:MAG: hypothetical protein ACI4WT_07155 [Oligosphaeraceae bacterium]